MLNFIHSIFIIYINSEIKSEFSSNDVNVKIEISNIIKFLPAIGVEPIHPCGR